MKKVTAYKNVEEAIHFLDNGGRFYNILTEAEDGIISESELGKVAGLFSDKQKMILFLDLSISKLNDKDQQNIISHLSDNLLECYNKYKSQNLYPSEINLKGKISTNAIITGIPKLIDTKSDMDAYIYTPIIASDETSYSYFPIIESYNVYEIRDKNSSNSFTIAHVNGLEKLPEEKIKVAGVLKEYQSETESDDKTNMFLEIVYFMEI